VSVAPSSYYAAKSRGPSPRAQRDAVLGPALVQLWKDNYCVYGAHKLWKTARRAGHDVGRDQVARLMRSAGIEGVRRGKRVRTTKPDPGAGRHPDLVKRNFTATAPNQLWVTDLQCRRRHCRSYADPRNMPMTSAMVLSDNGFGVVWSA
jgi:putative transposase